MYNPAHMQVAATSHGRLCLVSSPKRRRTGYGCVTETVDSQSARCHQIIWHATYDDVIALMRSGAVTAIATEGAVFAVSDRSMTTMVDFCLLTITDLYILFAFVLAH